MDERKKAQARVDDLFQLAKGARAEAVHERICRYAKRGVEAPGSLTPEEIQQICYALVAHYAQMGIG